MQLVLPSLPQQAPEEDEYEEDFEDDRDVNYGSDEEDALYAYPQRLDDQSDEWSLSVQNAFLTDYSTVDSELNAIQTLVQAIQEIKTKRHEGEENSLYQI